MQAWSGALVVGSPKLDGFGRGEHALKFPFGNLSILRIPAVTVIAARVQVGGFSGDGDGDDVFLGAWHEKPPFRIKCSRMGKAGKITKVAHHPIMGRIIGQNAQTSQASPYVTTMPAQTISATPSIGGPSGSGGGVSRSL